ncbi:hypothetical protein ACFQZ4_03645 [Catellatospora coxensis]
MRKLTVLMTVLLVAAAGTVVATPASAAPAVCALYCDTRDPSLARQETFPVPEVNLNGRRLVLHVSDADRMAWGSIDNGVVGDSVWLDRSWTDGSTWDGLLGRASIPSAWTGTRTLMYNLADPAAHRRGMVRACGNAGGVTCTAWVYVKVCDAVCDGADPAARSATTSRCPGPRSATAASTCTSTTAAWPGPRSARARPATRCGWTARGTRARPGPAARRWGGSASRPGRARCARPWSTRAIRARCCTAGRCAPAAGPPAARTAAAPPGPGPPPTGRPPPRTRWPSRTARTPRGGRRAGGTRRSRSPRWGTGRRAPAAATTGG